jgi:hypothetical protein
MTWPRCLVSNLAPIASATRSTFITTLTSQSGWRSPSRFTLSARSASSATSPRSWTTSRLWLLQQGRFRLATGAENLRLGGPAWRQLLQGFTVQKLGPGRNEAFLRSRAQEQELIGWIGLDTGERRLAPFDGAAHDVTAWGVSLLLLYERALIRTTGTAEYVVSTCAQGEVFIAVDIIPSSDDNTLSLVVASEDHSGGGTGSLRLFRI